MTTHPDQPQAWAQETQWLLNAFQRHRDALDALPNHACRPLVEIPPIARHLTFGTPLDVWATPAEVHTWNLTNEVNAFGQSIQKINAWARIFETFTRDEQINLVTEFINPLAVYALSLPFSLKNRFAFAAMRLSDEANRLCRKSTQQLPSTSDDMKSPKFEEMWKYTSEWRCSSKIKNIAERICPMPKDRAGPVHAYRDRFFHRIPHYIGLGVMERAVLEGNASSWTITNQDIQPVSLATIAADLTPQHAAAMQCHAALVGLVAEQWGDLSRNKLASFAYSPTDCN